MSAGLKFDKGSTVNQVNRYMYNHSGKMQLLARILHQGTEIQCSDYILPGTEGHGIWIRSGGKYHSLGTFRVKCFLCVNFSC